MLTDQALIEMGRRIQEDPAWFYVPGMWMRYLGDPPEARAVITSVPDETSTNAWDGTLVRSGQPLTVSLRDVDRWVPDLAHPATKGCFLEVLRAGFRRPTLGARQMSGIGLEETGGWFMATPGWERFSDYYSTEIEAMVSILRHANLFSKRRA